jgi:hypothetical protein
MTRSLALLMVTLLLPGAILAQAPRDHIADLAAQARARCATIPAADYRTGLFFNPKGFRSMFVRSECVQNLARDLRDESLCAQAVERTTWLFDGSGVSPAACTQQVRAQIARDQQDAARIIGTHRLTGVDLARNGNGRDVDLLVNTAGTYAHAYQLTVAVLDEASRSRAIFEARQPLGTADAHLRHFVTRDRLGTAVTSSTEATVTIVATLELVADTLDEAGVYQHLPRGMGFSQTGQTVDLRALGLR